MLDKEEMGSYNFQEVFRGGSQTVVTSDGLRFGF